MSSDVLLERMRQLSAVDRNAFDVYSQLAGKVKDPELVKLFSRLAKQEAQHMLIEKELIALLSTKPVGET